jgi:hypothetical protein
MSIAVTPTTPIEAEDDVTTQVEVQVEVRGRWDALALCEMLVPFHSFLVELTSERWVVHARAPGWRGEPLIGVLRAIDEWQADRPQDALVRIDVWLHRKPRSSASRSRRSAAPAAIARAAASDSRCREEEP